MNCVPKHSRDDAGSQYNIVCGADRKAAEFISNRFTNIQTLNFIISTEDVLFYRTAHTFTEEILYGKLHLCE